MLPVVGNLKPPDLTMIGPEHVLKLRKLRSDGEGTALVREGLSLPTVSRRSADIRARAAQLESTIMQGWRERRAVLDACPVRVIAATTVATDGMGRPRQEWGFRRDADWTRQALQAGETSFFLRGKVFTPLLSDGVRARLVDPNELHAKAILRNSPQDEALYGCRACFDTGAARSMVSERFAAILCRTAIHDRSALRAAALSISDGHRWVISGFRSSSESSNPSETGTSGGEHLGILPLAFFFAERGSSSCSIGAFVFTFLITEDLFVDVLFATDAMADFGAVCNVAEQSVSVCTRAASGCVAVPLDSVHSRVYIDTSTAPPLPSADIRVRAASAGCELALTPEEEEVFDGQGRFIPHTFGAEAANEFECAEDAALDWRVVFGVSQSEFERQRDLAVANVDPCVGEEGKQAVGLFITEFAEQFALGKLTAGQPAGQCTVRARLYPRKGAVPVFQQPRRIPFQRLALMEENVRAMRAAGVVSPQSVPSDWCANSFLIAKPHPPPDAPAELRYVTDFSRANPQFLRTGFTLAHTGELKQFYFRCLFFNSGDLCNSFWQVAFEEQCREYTTHHTTPALGPHVYNVMGMGLTSSTGELTKIITTGLQQLESERQAAFISAASVPEVDSQRMVQTAQVLPRDMELDELPGTYWSLTAYIKQMVDDVRFGTFSWQRSLEVWRLLLTVMRRLRLVFRLSKCYFLQSSMDSMGMQVSRDGISSSQEKIAPILDLPTPTNRAALARALGMFGFYIVHIPRFAEVTDAFRPLRVGPPLSQKQFAARWAEGGRADAAFTMLKECITSAPILGFLRPGGILVLFTDGSKTAMGAILTQFPPHEGGVFGLVAELRRCEGVGSGLRLRTGSISFQEAMRQGWLPPGACVIAYFSRRLSATQGRYGPHEIEQLAIIEAARAWKYYLSAGGDPEGTPVVCDHGSFEFTRRSGTLLNNARLHRAAMFLSTLHLIPVYRPQKYMAMVDTLSRDVPVLSDSSPTKRSVACAAAVPSIQSSGSDVDFRCWGTVAVMQAMVRCAPVVTRSRASRVADPVVVVTPSSSLPQAQSGVSVVDEEHSVPDVLVTELPPVLVIPASSLSSGSQEARIWGMPVSSFVELQRACADGVRLWQLAIWNLALLEVKDALFPCLSRNESALAERVLLDPPCPAAGVIFVCASLRAMRRSSATIADVHRPLAQGDSLQSRLSAFDCDAPVFLPPSLRMDAMLLAHDAQFCGGHKGYGATMASVSAHCFWPRLAADCKMYVSSCHVCQELRGAILSLPRAPRPIGPMQRLEPCTAWHLDFLKVPGNVLAVAVCIKTEYIEATWVDAEDALGAARLLLDVIIPRWLVPVAITGDGSQAFRSELMRLLASALLLPRNFTIPYSPWGNRTELANRILLEQFVAYSPGIPGADVHLRARLAAALTTVRTSPGRDGISAFQQVFGRPPRTVLSAASVEQVLLSNAFFNLREGHRMEAERFMRAQLDMQSRLDPALRAGACRDDQAQEELSSSVPLSRRVFKEGDLVLVAVPRVAKTDRRWRGPFVVVGVYGPAGAVYAVVVQIPNNPARRLFKVSLGRVKPYLAPASLRGVDPPSAFEQDGDDVYYEVSAIIRRVGMDEFLVSWKGYGRNADSVVPGAELRQSAPDLLAEYEQRTVFGPPVENFG